MLEAAGIAVTQDIEGTDLPDANDRLLGLTVREAITNILKHSQASSCLIEARHDHQAGRDGVRLVVADSGPAALHPVRTEGTGLKTLGERYRPLGGNLAFVQEDGGGGQLTGWLPIEDGDRR